jgi:predicted Zn-dependent protease
MNKALELNLEARRYEDRLNPYYRQQGHLLTGVNLSFIYLAKHDYPAARTEALRAIAAKPDDPNGWNCLGQAESQMGNFAAAERAFQKQADLAAGRHAINQ